jgi:hypothetical protein
MAKQSSNKFQPVGLRNLRAYQLTKQLAHQTYDDDLLQLYNQTWNTLGALIRSLRQKKLDGTWDRTYQNLKEGEDFYDV